jgi:CMP-N,N'-diacetyllegionaminic acid synthase
MDVSALILARGGSQRVPKKNIRIMAGKPMIGWTIEAARASGLFSEIVVSTDCPEIAEVSESLGANVPFLRPSHLAKHDSSSLDAIRHVMLQGGLSERIMLLQPTSPLRSATDIKQAWDLHKADLKRPLVSVCALPQKPTTLFSLRGTADATAELGQPALRFLDEIIHFMNGAIYLFSQSYVRTQGRLFDDHSQAYVMPLERSIDVDTELDFRIAEFLLLQSRVPI